MTSFPIPFRKPITASVFGLSTRSPDSPNIATHTNQKKQEKPAIDYNSHDGSRARDKVRKVTEAECQNRANRKNVNP